MAKPKTKYRVILQDGIQYLQYKVWFFWVYIDVYPPYLSPSLNPFVFLSAHKYDKHISCRSIDHTGCRSFEAFTESFPHVGDWYESLMDRQKLYEVQKKERRKKKLIRYL